jgi:DNA-binding NtrC family response regulator
MPKRILFVDDEKVILDVVSLMLQYEGYQVEARRDGSEAFSAFNQDPWGFDLVMTDLFMSELTGLGLAQKVRQIRPEIPIILLTGGDSGIESEAEALGIRWIAQKPIAMEPLIDMVKRALNE